MWAVPAKDVPGGYVLSVQNVWVDMSENGWLKVVKDYPVTLQVPEGIDIVAGLTGLLEKKLRKIEAEAGRAKAEVHAQIMQLQGITHQPAQREQHEPEAEDVEIWVEGDSVWGKEEDDVPF